MGIRPLLRQHRLCWDAARRSRLTAKLLAQLLVIVNGVRCRVCFRSAGENTELNVPPMVPEMDDLPIPDYSSCCKRFRLEPGTSDMDWVTLPDGESSHSCWWGARSDVRSFFCLRTIQAMTFRGESPEAVLRRDVPSSPMGVARAMSSRVDDVLDLGYI